MEKIFYGAGGYARENIGKWIAEGNIPACFADQEAGKWGQKLSGIEIFSLQDAVERYPDYQIVITVGQNYKEVYDFIIACGIPEERVEFIIPREYRKGCPTLGKMWQYRGGGEFSPCCWEHGYRVAVSSDFQNDYDTFLKLNEEIVRGFRENTSTPCDGCPSIYEDWWETRPKLQHISLATGFYGDACNVKCIYCAACEGLKDTTTVKVSTLDMCRYLSQKMDMTDVTFAFNNGEFTVNPERAEIMHLWEEKGWYGIVHTNAVKYELKLADLMQAGRAEINCSLDAGTQETFRKIKSVDKFDQVCKNLEEYSKNGCVVLQYIMLKGINDNLTDISGFVEFAEKIHAKAMLSRDVNVRNERIGKDESELVEYFVKECKKRSVCCEFVWHCFCGQDFDYLRGLL